MNKAILCVDDERSILTALEQQIVGEFAETHILEFAESGEEALEIMDDLKHRGVEISLVITDEMMPGIKGHVLIEKIAELSGCTRCILLTGYAESDILQSISSLNLAKCIAKPWDLYELMDAIKMNLTV